MWISVNKLKADFFLENSYPLLIMDDRTGCQDGWMQDGTAWS